MGGAGPTFPPSLACRRPRLSVLLTSSIVSLVSGTGVVAVVTSLVWIPLVSLSVGALSKKTSDLFVVSGAVLRYIVCYLILSPLAVLEGTVIRLKRMAPPGESDALVVHLVQVG